MSNRQALRVGRAEDSAPLSAQQKKFNTLVKRIANRRKLLEQWQALLPEYRRQYEAEFMPQLRHYRELQAELAQWLDAAAGSRKLTATERSTLKNALAERCFGLSVELPDGALREQMKALYQRYSGADFDAEMRQSQDEVCAMAKDMLGVELGADLDIRSPADLLRRLAAQAQAAQEAEPPQDAPEPRKSGKKPGMREQRRQALEQQSSQSLREIYRQLASALHPDRESDPQEKERKTALMQRINQAHAAGNLLDLLQLQLEVEQIDPAHIANLSEQRLAHYNHVLGRQSDGLKMQIEMFEQMFCAEFNLDPQGRHKPECMLPQLMLGVHDMVEDIGALQAQLDALRQDPRVLKHWLKKERQDQRMQQVHDMMDDDLLAGLNAILGQRA